MTHIDLHLYNPHQASESYPFSSIDASANADADAPQTLSVSRV